MPPCMTLMHIQERCTSKIPEHDHMGQEHPHWFYDASRRNALRFSANKPS